MAKVELNCKAAGRQDSTQPTTATGYQRSRAAIRTYGANLVIVSVGGHNKFYRDCRNHHVTDQDSCSLDWRRYQPMWRRRMTGRALAATKVAIAFSCYHLSLPVCPAEFSGRADRGRCVHAAFNIYKSRAPRRCSTVFLIKPFQHSLARSHGLVMRHLSFSPHPAPRTPCRRPRRS
jgi:hypothetical protein